jgi:hypothetical protein
LPATSYVDAAGIYGMPLPHPWWEMPEQGPGTEANQFNAKLAGAVIQTVQDIERRQPGIWEGHRRHARIYAGYLPSALAWGISPQANQRLPYETTKALVRSICDTATALIIRSRPRPAIVTDGADWKMQQQAEDLEQFMTGAYEVGDLYPVAARCFHDSTVFGTGCWMYVPQGEGDHFKVKCERVLIDDLVVDEEECREHLEPENVYRRVMVRIDALIRKYAPNNPRLADRLRATTNHGGQWPTRHVPMGRCVLVEAINLPNRRRTLCVDGVVLEDGEWPYDFFPYTFLWWAPPLSGFYGDGIAYRQYGRQLRITYSYRWIQRVHDLFATPRAWVDPAGGPVTLQVSNELGSIISARKPPTFQSQNMVPGEVYSWLDKLEKGGYDDEGISQVTANNQLPPGLESAPAQREYSFKEGQRFAPVSQRWEDAVAVEACRKFAAMYRHAMSKGGKAARVRWADRRLMHTIEWPDLEADAYRIRPEAASLESLSPASRAQAALELAQTGWITPLEGRDLAALPDLKESNDLDTSPMRYARMVVRRMYRGEHIEVDEYADLQVLSDVVRKARLVAIERGAPPRIVDNLSEFLDRLQDVVSAAAQPGPTGPAGGPAAPAMAPSAAPGGMPVPLQGR